MLLDCGDRGSHMAENWNEARFLLRAFSRTVPFPGPVNSRAAYPSSFSEIFVLGEVLNNAKMQTHWIKEIRTVMRYAVLSCSDLLFLDLT